MNITLNLNHLLIIGIIIILVNHTLNNKFNENFSTKEAVENVASLYNKEKLTVTNANITKNLNAKNFKGIIVAWSGDQNNIPVGWVLCDGNNKTPNLKDRFILGYGKNKINTKGGEEEHKLTIEEMPTHYHELPTQWGKKVWAVDHTGKGTYGGKHGRKNG